MQCLKNEIASIYILMKDKSVPPKPRSDAVLKENKEIENLHPFLTVEYIRLAVEAAYSKH